MGSKTFLLLTLAFAVVLLVTSEVAASSRHLASDDGEVVEDGKYGGELHGRYNVEGLGGYKYNNGEGQVAGDKSDDDNGDDQDGGGSIQAARCRHRCCHYNHKGWCTRCCHYAEAVAYEQTRN
ncbi:hypothetical protein L6452_00697 [Arctium lappa]|uniref:Uncharacterized protein n=1 Tax=Arctium lappa TaxID=4217 RepID=A0ACB9FF88_ARCLA|nr:hypothetical protein L6452_00697 [Arctium lappa]